MNRPSDRNDGRSVAPWLLGGFVAVLLVVDLSLLVSPGAASALRLPLAVGAVATIPAGIALGVTHRPRYAVGSLLASPVVAVYAVSGLILPWNQLAFVVGQRTLEAVLAVPVIGDGLATALFGGVTLSAESLRRAFRYHYAVVAVATVGLVAAAVRARWAAAGDGDH